MIRIKDGLFELTTKSTTYAFRMLPTGHLEHLYYGKRITLFCECGDASPTAGESDAPTACESALPTAGESGALSEANAENDAKSQNAPIPCADALREKQAFAPGNTNVYDDEHKSFTLEDICLEMSSYGKGDIREPFVEIEHADGSVTSDFLYESHLVTQGKEPYETLPGSYDETGAVEHLCVTLRDRQYDVVLELHYYVFEDTDVIARSAKIRNESGEKIRLRRVMSLQLDLPDSGYRFTAFHGAWAREMKRSDTLVTAGKFVNSSYTGTTSNRANSFVMLSRRNTTEDYGPCYGFHLVYSGNHYEAAEVSSFSKTRFVSGINPQSFCFVCEPGESFEAPEAVMSFSDQGFNGLSTHLHAFIREHIVRGVWKHKERPVLLNSWEAAYFDISERSLLKLAKAGKDVGIELFVMDDGWFGERNDDAHSLGDWTVNQKKLPGGLKGLADKVKELGLDFGIWVEPEMVNVESRLYREHPDWVMDIPGKPHSEGRNQRVLDLCNAEVQDYIIDQMSQVFSSADISYVKWDMNRTFSDIYSRTLPPERQGEVAHRYVCGLYRCMRELTERFPDILFEGCSAGGNRFDLGVLCYFPQIWGSDNTDALCRAEIQNNYSYGYPLSTVSAHVSSCPNHQTLRVTPIESRFAVAAFGVCGYECNLCDATAEQLDFIRAQITLYKKWRPVLQFGSFYRGRSFGENGAETGVADPGYGYGGVLENTDGNVTEWCVVSPDQSAAVGMLMQRLVIPNSRYQIYRARGLKPEARYQFYSLPAKINVKEFGDLVNTMAPIHIRQGSLVHDLVAKFVKLDQEVEDCQAYGDALMYVGVKLKQGFAGTGFDNQVRHFPDFAARLYFLEEVAGDSQV